MDFTQATAQAMSSLSSFVPELILVATLLLVLLADLIIGRGRPLGGPKAPPGSSIPGWIAIAGLVGTALAAVPMLSEAPRAIFFGMLAADSMAAFFKILFALSTTLIVLVSFRMKHQGEFLVLLIAAVLGMNLLAAGRHLLMIVVSLELVSVMSYVLAGFNRKSDQSSEAALKYMIFGAMASGSMLFGISLIFGLTGSLNLAAVQASLAVSSPEKLTLLLSLLLVLAGIGYKIAMVPFHFWCPDVYEGAPTPITTFFSVGPKAAGLALFIRFLYPSMSGHDLTMSIPATDFNPALLIGILAAFTMTLGNMSAIGQHRTKRLLAFSSIAHAGYLMMGLVLATTDGLHAVLFYLVLYFFMNYGAFLVVDAVAQMTDGDDSLDAFVGLGKRHPGLAFAMTVFLVSLVGLPPMAGFIGKYILFLPVIESGWYWLVTIAVLNSVVSLFYYFSIVKSMYMAGDGEEVNETANLPIMHSGIIAALCALTMILGLFWSPLVDFTRAAMSSLL
jgi:NADH-quinone oxidoreductase subunit N